MGLEMNQKYEFKKLYCKEKPDDCIFHAILDEQGTYEVVVDDAEIFTEIFQSILRGTYRIGDGTVINTGNAVKNIQAYLDVINSTTTKDRFILRPLG